MVFDFLRGKKTSSEGGDVSLEVVDPRQLESHCLIAGNLHIRGDVYFSGTLRVDGRVDGKVSIYDGGRGQVVVSKGAVINGPVYATNVLADGTISGSMVVEDKLECRAHAVIRGDVIYGSIHISDGARIEARCRQREQNRLRDVSSSKDGKQKAGDPYAVTDFLATKKAKK